jgi:spore coat protein A, manganese oxidase
LHLSQFQVLNRQAIAISDPNTKDPSKDDPSQYYLAAWLKAYGTDSSAGCTAGAYCLNYGPPLDYLAPNKDGAIGGNPAFSGYFTKDSNGKVIPPTPPRPSESGWKDTADAFANQVLRILVRWTPSDVPITPNTSYAGENFYRFDPTQGYYVWHCHVLTHEDNEMMRPYRVVP